MVTNGVPPVEFAAMRRGLDELAGGDTVVLQEFLGLLADSLHRSSTMLVDAVDGGGRRQIAQAAHRLRGTSLTSGLTSIAGLAERIELGEPQVALRTVGLPADREAHAGRVLKANDRMVISTGGGIVSQQETFDCLLGSCFTVWVRAQPEEHMARVVAQGDLRPMAGNDKAMEDLKRILDAREPMYGKADAVVDTSGETVEQSYVKLKHLLSG